MKTMIIDGVEYIEVPEDANLPLCYGCDFLEADKHWCEAAYLESAGIFGGDCAARSVIYKAVK